MGLNVLLAALNDEQREQLLVDADAIVAAASVRRRRTDRDWVLNLGRVGDDLVAILTDLTDAITGDALRATRTGRAVGADHDEEHGMGRPHYLTAAQVSVIAGSLEVLLRSDPVPRPDEDGYCADPRIDTDEEVARAAKVIEKAGLDPRSPREMEDLRLTLDSLRDHYMQASSRGGGMLVFLR